MSDQADLKYYFNIARSNKRIIVIGSLLIIAITGMISSVMPKLYSGSILLEIGIMYLPIDQWRRETQLIEAPRIVKELLLSDSVLNRAREQNHLKTSLEKLKKRIEIPSDPITKDLTQVLNIEYLGNSPQETVIFLNSIVEPIISLHEVTYLSYSKSIENKIKYIQDKIAAIEKVVSARVLYRELSQRYMDKGGGDIEAFSKELSELQSAKATPVEVLFLQSANLTEKQNLIYITEFKSKMDILIGEDEKNLADAQIEIVDLETRLALSYPTRIKAPAVLPNTYVRPNIILNIIAAGLLGPIFMILYVFFREYIRTP